MVTVELIRPCRLFVPWRSEDAPPYTLGDIFEVTESQLAIVAPFVVVLDRPTPDGD